MNDASPRIQRLARELSEELTQQCGPERAARMFERLAADIRAAAGAQSTRRTAEWHRLGRGATHGL